MFSRGGDCAGDFAGAEEQVQSTGEHVSVSMILGQHGADFALLSLQFAIF